MKAIPTLYLIRGVSGSGKSSLALSMLSCGMVDCIHEADHFFYKKGEYLFDASKIGFAHVYCQQNTELSLRSGYSVAVSNTSTSEKEVQVYQQLAEKIGVKFVSIVVENRNNTKSIHGVPGEILSRQRSRFTVKL